MTLEEELKERFGRRLTHPEVSEIAALLRAKLRELGEEIKREGVGTVDSVPDGTTARRTVQITCIWNVHQRWPMTAAALRGLAEALEDIEHRMDWCLSGDTGIEDDLLFDKECMAKLSRAVAGGTGEEE